MKREPFLEGKKYNNQNPDVPEDFSEHFFVGLFSANYYLSLLAAEWHSRGAAFSRSYPKTSVTWFSETQSISYSMQTA